MKKGQVEFIIILGIVFLFAVVLFYSFWGWTVPSPVPQGVAEKQSLVAETIREVIGDGAELILKDLETHGGFLSEPLLAEGIEQPDILSTVFSGYSVPFWQMCDSVEAPSREVVEHRFARAMENYLENRTPELRNYFGRNVTFEEPEASVAISDRFIDISINMPTRVEGYLIPAPKHPYTHRLNTLLGEITSFGGDFATEQANNRLLEVFTVTSIFHSRYLPSLDVQIDCTPVYIEPEDAAEYLRGIAWYTIDNLLFWSTDVPEGGRTYVIEYVNRKQYRDLKFDRFLPDDFSFVVTEPISIIPIPASGYFPAILPGLCITPYYYNYTMSYPVVVRVDDSLSGNMFLFSLFVDVDKNVPGECLDITVEEGPCAELDCYAKINVRDSYGPLEGSAVSFGECFMGYTDEQGVAEGAIKCGTHDIGIYHNSSYVYYTETVSSLGINSSVHGPYILKRVSNITLHFKQVRISGMCQSMSGEALCEPCTSYSSPAKLFCEVEDLDEWAWLTFGNSEEYLVSNIDADSIPDECVTDSDACLNAGVTDTVNVEYIPSGLYTATAVVWNYSGDSCGQMGYFQTSYDIAEGESELFAYIPTTSNSLGELSDYQKSCLSNYMDQCGIPDLSESEFTYEEVVLASCDCSELESIAWKCLLTQEEKDALFWTGPPCIFEDCTLYCAEESFRNTCEQKNRRVICM